MVQTIMSDLGMGEDQSKIDALEQYLEENLSTFFNSSMIITCPDLIIHQPRVCVV